MAIDFGLAGFVDKIEEHWGKVAGRVVSLVAGLAIVAVGVSAIGQLIVVPIVNLVRSPTWQMTLVYLVLTIFAIGIGVGVGLYLSAAFTHWRQSRREGKMLRQAKETVARVQDLLTDAEQTQANSIAFANEAKSGFREIMDGAAAALEDSQRMYRESIQVARTALDMDPSIPDFERAQKRAALDELEAELAESERRLRERPRAE